MNVTLSEEQPELIDHAIASGRIRAADEAIHGRRDIAALFERPPP